MLAVECYPRPMKPVLLVLGIFLLTGALLAGGWSLRFDHPGEYETYLDQPHPFARDPQAGMAEATEQHQHLDNARLTAGVCGAFALLAFALAAVWPKKSSPSPR